MSIHFEWDPVKARRNLRKHGVSFDVALRVFADPLALTKQEIVEGGELRWRTLGRVGEHAILLVAHAVREDDQGGEPIEVIRIISARPADRKERDRYEQETR
jgi:uncharacterized DUF497 family protein